jgi:hypothetical protein
VFEAESVWAGPPLLCRPIEIGNQVSLPWGDGTWSNNKIEMDDDAFLARTLELLAPDVSALIRMETIRRATIHAAERPKTAASILAVLRGRVSKSTESGVVDPMALFDLGYLMASYEQMNIVTEHNTSGVDGRTRRSLDVPSEPDPYVLVRKASDLAKNPPEIEFALALMTLHPERASHKTHLERAVDGAVEGSLLATNLVRDFGSRGQTLTDLRTSFGMGDNGERR